ncbi:sensor histidine kinase [Deinococcus aestuarii]|uniref:sensor histidine kinase n=1 Tax=Deinococcus aestuarii TaxID=2774531 RepID=UPI001C0BA36D|nr:HAMP domain-containing sensor histidine kinase [Deinococcus aestuarii]
MTFRWRLTLTYAALLGLTLLIAGGLSYAAFRHTLYATLDDDLRTHAQKQAAMDARARRPSHEKNPALDAINRQQPLRLTVYDASGHEVDWGPSRVGFIPRAGTFQVASERVFMLRTPQGWIQASQPDGGVRAALGQILRLQLLGVPLLLLLALGLGYVLADRALRPVDQVSDLAARIARSGQPGERVPVAPGSDELARLTRTINDMLGKLDALLTRERLFAHASAHELRTPISVIRATASLALERERTPAQYREALAQVQDVSEDMSALTHRLMELARATRPPEGQAVDLADVTLMAAELHSPDARKNVHLQVTLGNAPTTGDFDALVLAARNLIQNAIDHGSPGSTVRISCRADDEHARFTVQDAGPGIPEAEIPRLTQPFQRGQGTQHLGGAGLGLALVQAIVEAHGGRLDLANPPEGGLRAELILPRRA